MITLILILHLSPLFGGEIHATLTYPTVEACEATVKQLEKFTVRYEVVKSCKD